MALTEAQALEALRPVEDPEIHRSIVELDMVRDLTIDEQTVRLKIALTVPGCPLKDEIKRRVHEALLALDGVEAVDLGFTVMTEEERAKIRDLLQGTAGERNGHGGHGHAKPRRPIPFVNGSSRTRVLLIASGKGGVGKSTVTTNLAVALAQRGRKVAILDADVYNFSIPRMLGVLDFDPELEPEKKPRTIPDPEDPENRELIIPSKSYGVAMMSMGFFAEEDQPVIWRGPKMHGAIEQFLTDVVWDDPDYLLIDMPPGTGDVSLSLAQFLPGAEMYVVTTPQPVSGKVAQRAGIMARHPQVQLELKGVIENMSWFDVGDGIRHTPFGEGGGTEMADDLEVPLLGQIPLVTALREGSDSGQPIVAVAPNSEASQVFTQIAETIDVAFKPTKRRHRELKVL